MSTKVNALIDRIREARGPFFVARLHLRVQLPLDGEEVDSPEAERQILEACRTLGFDPAPLVLQR